jgi:hypothetical protein
MRLNCQGHLQHRHNSFSVVKLCSCCSGWATGGQMLSHPTVRGAAAQHSAQTALGCCNVRRPAGCVLEVVQELAVVKAVVIWGVALCKGHWQPKFVCVCLYGSNSGVTRSWTLAACECLDWHRRRRLAAGQQSDRCFD